MPTPARNAPARLVVIALAAAAGAACAACGARDGGATSDSAAASAEAAAGPTAADDGATVDFTSADLDAYERGLRREIELVRAGRATLAAATTPEARGAAIQAQWPQQTMPQAAVTVGMTADRYEQLRRSVDPVLQTLDFQGKIDGPLSMDTARATPEMCRRLAGDPLAELPPASAAALRERLPRLAPVWAEYMGLTAVGG
jgi:hypothetical protein